MKRKMEQFPAKNPNPVLSVGKDGTVLYSNEAGEPLLHGWGVRVGEKLPFDIGDILQRVISRNSPEKMEVKVGKRVYLVAFQPLLEEECVNLYGFDISDQKETEEKFRESEEKYRNIIETANEGIWIFDAEARTTYVNNKMAEMLGYTQNEIIGRFAWDFADEEGKAVFEMNMEKRRQGINESHEFKLTRKDGSSLWTIVNAKSLIDKDGKFIGSMGMLTDITQRKEAETKLREILDNLENLVKARTSELEEAYKSLQENERRLSEAQKIAHIGSWDWNIITDKAYWSNELYRIFGRNPQESEVTYDTFLSHIHPADRDYVNSAVKKALNGEQFNIDYRIVSPDGKERIVHEQGEVIFDENNLPARMRGTVQDITEHKRVDEALRKSEEKYRNIVEIANEGILVINAEFRITYYNKKLMEMLGYNMEEGIGRPMWDFISEESKVSAKLHMEKRQLGINESYELELICKDGSPLWALINAKSLFDKDGKFMGSISMLTDITERKVAENALANIETARKKEIHHRIKNNLQVISSLLDLQAEQFKGRKDIKDSEVLEAFRESQDRVISMALIHEELYRGGGFETLDFSPYIEELAENLLQTYTVGNTDISLNMGLEENLFFDMDTAVPLGMIVNELVSNSLKHAFIGRNEGEIRIKLHREDNGECTKSINEDCKSTTFVLTVSDNGVGIPEDLDIEELDSLGMQLVTSLVDQLDGEFELKRDNGTEFTVRFTVTEKDNSLSAPVP